MHEYWHPHDIHLSECTHTYIHMYTNLYLSNSENIVEFEAWVINWSELMIERIYELVKARIRIIMYTSIDSGDGSVSEFITMSDLKKHAK